MNEYNELIKRFTAIEDELVRLRKQRNYDLFNLDESNIPRLRTYSQLISENKQAISLVEQNVSDVESSVTLLSQFTSFDNVVVVEASDDKTGWDKSKVYYDSSADVYWYHDGTQWKTTDSPITAGLDTSIAQIQAKTSENEAEIALVAKSVTQNTEDITGLQTLTGQIDGEIKTVKTNLATVETKADDAAASAELAAQSVTELEGEVSGKFTTINENIASVKATADNAGASVALLSQYTSMDNVVNVTSDTNTSWDKAKVYYNTSNKKYWYYDSTSKKWVNTTEPVTAKLNSSLAQVKTTADSASASVSTIVKNVGADGTVNAASIVAKINAAGSSVQITADHISLNGKTIALTSDSINISSTYFNVATSGAVSCTSLAVAGNDSSINVTGSSYSSSIIKVSYDNSAYVTDIRPNGVYSVTGSLGFEGSSQRVQVSANGNYYQYSNLSSYEVICNYYQHTYPTFHANSNANQVIVGGMFTCLGAKSRTEQTKHYGNRLMYAFESPNPLYSDFGRATIADDGLCYVFLDPVFYECIDNNYDYFVFIQPENGGEFAVIDRTSDHFTVRGTPGELFAWMLVTAQKGYSATRTEEIVIPEPEPAQTPEPDNAVYDAVGDEILKEFENQLG